MQNLNLFHVRINDDTILDTYIYCGNIISVTKDGTIKVLPLTKIFYDYRSRNKEKFFSCIELALLRNDWFENPQGRNFFRIDDARDVFFNLWKDFSSETFFYELDEWENISSIKSMPVYDMKAYGLKLFLGTGDGLYEMPVSAKEYFPIKLNGKIEKRFDARVVGLSAKNGEVAISSGYDGLYHGSLWNSKNTLEVDEQQKQKRSIRTNWINSFNLINYESNNNFSYMINKTTNSKDRPFKYSAFDDSSQKRKIEKFGDKIISMGDLIKNSAIKKENVIYSYNSNKTTFFVLNDGNIFSTNALNENNIHLSSRINSVSQLKENFSKEIMSVNFIHGGTIIEYFDSTILRIDDDYHLLSNEPIISIRTFSNSKRYKKIIAITDENGISLFVVPIIHTDNSSLYWRK